jgi:voltage-gated potassium channel
MGPKIWALVKELRFLQLTLYFILFLFAFPLFGQEWLVKLVSGIFLLNALLVSLSASGRTIQKKWLLWLFFGTSVLFAYLSLATIDPNRRLFFLKLAMGSDIVLLLICLTTILAFIFESTQITLDTIFAAVAAYLIIAFTFAQAYLFLHYFSPGSFNLPAAVSSAAFSVFQGDMIYYSLVIITTVGIGDIIPETHLARTLTVLEAMVGQFFVAILVAWLVGRFISQSKSAE